MARYPTSSSYAMRVQARPGSAVEQRYKNGALPSGELRVPTAIAPGIDPSPLDDLLFHGGKVIPQMGFRNVFLGTPAVWTAEDTSNIDAACKRIMQDRKLNNVMRQYFPGANISCDVKASFIFDEAAARTLDEPDIKELVTRMFDSGLLGASDLGATIHNLILPPGVVLRLDESSSLAGLGGYHGSVHIRRGNKPITLYYSANVYSQQLPNGRENGINVFDAPWKNVVGTLYHEMQEFRTDPDVGDAIEKNEDGFLGWMSRRGQEVGDQPISRAPSLELVFKEVSAGRPARRSPVQFMYSNAVHGAEGPIAKPHA